MKKRLTPLLLLLTVALLAACTSSPTKPAADEPQTLTVMTHDSFAISEDLVAEFEAEHNVKISFVRSGDTGSALNRAILSKDNPLADVFYGVDNTFLARALNEGIFESYESPVLENVPDEFEIDPNHEALPVDYGDVCINYDKAWFEDNDLAVPTSLEELTQPEYEGLLVMENPATSSPGLAFLMATIAQFGEDGYLDYWSSLADNGLTVVNDWETAYYTNFSASTGQGSQPMVVSYGSSPPVEVVYAETPMDEAPTDSIVGPNACFRQIEFVGILKGTPNRDLAEAFVDFMLSSPFQEDIPLQMFVFPVNTEAQLPQVFIDNVSVPEQPATLSPDLIEENREAWINAWTETVLQ
ncbi:thiamine ABC transporter substrate-binding protein [bacterium]|nr:thiamine ABC transporter substrate-binding protein [bacterium]